MKKTASYQAFLIERLRNDEALREAYLNEALQDEDQSLILLAIRNVAKATGGLTRLAKNTGLNRQNLYRTLSKEGNPTWQRIEKIFDGLGYPLRAISQKKLILLEKSETTNYLKNNSPKRTAVVLREGRTAFGKSLKKKV